MDVLTPLWAQIKRTWEGLSPNQRVVAALLVVVIAAGLGGASLWGGRAEYVPLFPRPLESPEAVGSVLKVLEGAAIPARQERGQILVPAAQHDRAFMELSGKSAWPQDQSTVEMADLSNDWRLSDPARRERARLSLQGRLGRMVAMMDGVQSAGVLLAEGNNAVFSGERFEPKATVQVVLRPRVEALSPGVAETIRRMVAFGVQGVKPAAVAVVDSLGRIYEEQAGDDEQRVMTTFEKLQREREEDIVRKVRNALSPVAGPRVSVVASVAVNRDRVREKSVRVNPDEVVVTREKTESIVRSAPSAEQAGVPGTASNLVEPAPAAAGASGASASTEERSEIDRVASTIETETVKGTGEVKQATVGILIPYPKGSPKPDDATVDTYRGFAMKAAGITDPQLVTVAGVPYEAAASVPASRWQEALAMAVEHADRLLLAFLTVGAVLALFLALRRAGGGSARSGGMEGAVAAIAKAGQAAMEPLPEMSPEGMRFTEMERRIREMVRKDPKISAGLVKRWLMTAK